VHSAVRSMASLSLLGTVVRDKMMKTATVQVISPTSVIVSPCFLHMNHVLDIRLRCCLQQLDSANARRPHAHANACTRWLVISLRTHTRSPRCTRCTSDHMCVPAASCHSANTAHTLPCSSTAQHVAPCEHFAHKYKRRRPSSFASAIPQVKRTRLFSHDETEAC
jgi:hypothetical protein